MLRHLSHLRLLERHRKRHHALLNGLLVYLLMELHHRIHLSLSMLLLLFARRSRSLLTLTWTFARRWRTTRPPMFYTRTARPGQATLQSLASNKQMHDELSLLWIPARIKRILHRLFVIY